MKNLLLFAGILLFMVGCSNQSDELSNDMGDEIFIREHQSSADYSIPNDLSELEARSDHIVKVKAINDVGYDMMDDEIFGSKKKVNVIESFENELDNDEVIIVEPAYVENGEYISTESYIKMIDGEEYVLFLIQGDADNEYGLTALGFGKYSGDRSSKHSSISSFETLSEIDSFDFLSSNEEEINLYEEIKEDVLKKFSVTKKTKD